MRRFDYDNIEAEELLLEFRCYNCDKIIKTEKLKVPEMNLENVDSPNQLSYFVNCPCGNSYSIVLYNGVYANYGTIRGLKDDYEVVVHEVPAYPYGKKTIFVDIIHSISTVKSIINEIDENKISEKGYLYNLIFSHLITLIDSFMKISIEPIILHDDILIRRFIGVFKNKRKNENEKDYIKRYFKEHSFQNPNNQVLLLFEVLQLDKKYKFPNELENYIAIRNILIHRNGIHEDGYAYKVTKVQLLSALQSIENHIVSINKMLIQLEADIAVKRIFNCNNNKE